MMERRVGVRVTANVGAVVQAVVGLALVAFVPGFALLRATLPRVRGAAATLVGAVALSIASLVLVLYTANVTVGLAVSGTHAVWVALAITVAAGSAAWVRMLTRALDEGMRAR